MGGLVNTIIRKPDNSDVSFKLNTNYWAKRFLTPNIFNQKYLEKQLKVLKKMDLPRNLEQHNTYQNGISLRAPFDYGLLLIDYIDQEIHSINKFAPFAVVGSYFLNKEYSELKKDLVLTKDNKALALEPGDELVYPHVFHFNQLLRFNPNFVINGNTLYISIMTPFEILDYILEHGYQVEENLSSNIPIEYFSDIDIDFPDWDIFEYDTTSSDFDVVFNIMLSKFELTDSDILAWEDYLKTL